MNPENLKTLEDFHAFFEAIPDDRWTTCSYVREEGVCCAAGHLGDRTEDSDHKAGLDLQQAIFEVWYTKDSLDSSYFVVPHFISVNDNQDPRFRQETPRARILALILKTIQMRDASKEST